MVNEKQYIVLGTVNARNSDAVQGSAYMAFILSESIS